MPKEILKVIFRNINIYYKIDGATYLYTDTSRFDRCYKAVEHFQGMIKRHVYNHFHTEPDRIFGRYGK